MYRCAWMNPLEQKDTVNPKWIFFSIFYKLEMQTDLLQEGLLFLARIN